LSRRKGLRQVVFAHPAGFLAVIDAKDAKEAAEVAKQLVPHAVVKGPALKV